MKIYQHIYTRCNMGHFTKREGYDTAAISPELSRETVMDSNLTAVCAKCNALTSEDSIISVTATRDANYTCITRQGQPSTLYGSNIGRNVIFAHQLIVKTTELMQAYPAFICNPVDGEGKSAFITEYDEKTLGSELKALDVSVEATRMTPTVGAFEGMSRNAFCKFIDGLSEIIQSSGKTILVLFDDIETAKECTERACCLMSTVYTCVPEKLRMKLHFCSFRDDISVCAPCCNVIFSCKKLFEKVPKNDSGFIVIDAHNEDYETNDSEYKASIWEIAGKNDTKRSNAFYTRMQRQYIQECSVLSEVEEQFEMLAIMDGEAIDGETYQIITDYITSDRCKGVSKACLLKIAAYYLGNAQAQIKKKLIELYRVDSVTYTALHFAHTLRMLCPEACFEMNAEAHNMVTDSWFDKVLASKNLILTSDLYTSDWDNAIGRVLSKLEDYDLDAVEAVISLNDEEQQLTMLRTLCEYVSDHYRNNDNISAATVATTVTKCLTIQGISIMSKLGKLIESNPEMARTMARKVITLACMAGIDDPIRVIMFKCASQQNCGSDYAELLFEEKFSFQGMNAPTTLFDYAKKKMSDKSVCLMLCNVFCQNLLQSKAKGEKAVDIELVSIACICANARMQNTVDKDLIKQLVLNLRKVIDGQVDMRTELGDFIKMLISQNRPDDNPEDLRWFNAESNPKADDFVMNYKSLKKEYELSSRQCIPIMAEKLSRLSLKNLNNSAAKRAWYILHWAESPQISVEFRGECRSTKGFNTTAEFMKALEKYNYISETTRKAVTVIMSGYSGLQTGKSYGGARSPMRQSNAKGGRNGMHKVLKVVVGVIALLAVIAVVVWKLNIIDLPF